MKVQHLFFALLFAFGLAFSFAACDSAADDTATDEATEQTDDQASTSEEGTATETSDEAEATEASETDQSGPEYTSKYVCPMHCEGSGSAEPGKCPKCGMEYVMNENYQEEGAMEDDGHDHGDHQH